MGRVGNVEMAGGFIYAYNNSLLAPNGASYFMFSPSTLTWTEVIDQGATTTAISHRNFAKKSNNQLYFLGDYSDDINGNGARRYCRLYNLPNFTKSSTFTLPLECLDNKENELDSSLITGCSCYYNSSSSFSLFEASAVLLKINNSSNSCSILRNFGDEYSGYKGLFCFIKNNYLYCCIGKSYNDYKIFRYNLSNSTWDENEFNIANVNGISLRSYASWFSNCVSCVDMSFTFVDDSAIILGCHNTMLKLDFEGVKMYMIPKIQSQLIEQGKETDNLISYTCNFDKEVQGSVSATKYPAGTEITPSLSEDLITINNNVISGTYTLQSKSL